VVEAQMEAIIMLRNVVLVLGLQRSNTREAKLVAAATSDFQADGSDTARARASKMKPTGPRREESLPSDDTSAGPAMWLMGLQRH
jgi:hypothetical protein